MRLRKLVTMREALDDLGYFGRLLAGDSWAAWRVLLIAICGEELTDGEREVFKARTGREREPLEMVEEFWAIIGRRGGKTRAAGILAGYLGAVSTIATSWRPASAASCQSSPPARRRPPRHSISLRAYSKPRRIFRPLSRM